MQESLEMLYDIIKTDYLERNSILNLNASENHMSRVAKYILGFHPAYDCYEFPPSGGNITGPWEFSGPPNNEKFVHLISKQCSCLLGSSRVNVRARGGQSAEIAVMLGLAKSGDHVFYVSEQDGGHFGLTKIAQSCGIHLHAVHFNLETHLLDLELTLSDMKSVWSNTALKLLMINQSFILREQNWEKIVSFFKNAYPDIIISCDVSHLLGLIIGKQIHNPLDFGVDLIHGSTHKTFPGPQKGIIVFHSDFDSGKASLIEETISPLLQSSCGTAEIIVLAYVMCEMDVHATSYAKAICNNAKVFANALAKLKWNIVGQSFDYTQTHQCWLILGDEEKSWLACGLLHQAGLRCLPAYLPFVGKWGLRFGVNSLTRRGLQSQHFIKIASWINDLLRSKVSAAHIRQDVVKLSSDFPLSNLKFTLDYNYLSVFSKMFFKEIATSWT